MPVYGWVAVAILITGLAVLLIGGNDGVLFGVDPGQIAALTAMMALLVYLGGGLVGRGQPIGPMLRQLLVWGALLAVILAAYLGYQAFAG